MSESPLVIVVVITAAPGRADELEQALGGAVRASHEDEGCELYALHRARDDDHCFVLVEKWQSEDHLERHRAASRARPQPFVELIEGSVDLRVFDPVVVGDPTKGAL